MAMLTISLLLDCCCSARPAANGARRRRALYASRAALAALGSGREVGLDVTELADPRRRGAEFRRKPQQCALRLVASGVVAIDHHIPRLAVATGGVIGGAIGEVMVADITQHGILVAAADELHRETLRFLGGYPRIGAYVAGAACCRRDLRGNGGGFARKRRSDGRSGCRRRDSGRSASRCFRGGVWWRHSRC